ncbi:hypothetical protein [Streptomyces sp. NPDC001985]|uniref:hypothetical protein n=1 Tax=Streptomyces sp. NPDC001985 TaxID=3154406 RepID=UPI003322F5FF
MTSFADEARDRVAHLLRMARTDDDRARARIITYAEATPDPPLMGPQGIHTSGCPRCAGTMWLQRELHVCSSCGHMEDA